MCCISIIGLVLPIVDLVLLHTLALFILHVSNGIFELFSQRSSIHIQPHVHLTLLTYIELFNLQIS
jgi:hypothetical protein